MYVAFICEDAHIWAEHTKRDTSVRKDDTVEVFTALNLERPQAYFNIEMNVLGIFLDQFYPDGLSMPVKEEWNGKGIQVKPSIVGTQNDDSDEDQYWILEAAIPFQNFADVVIHTPQRPGECMASGVEPVGRKDESAIQPVVGKPDREAAVSFTG